MYGTPYVCVCNRRSYMHTYVYLNQNLVALARFPQPNKVWFTEQTKQMVILVREH